MPQPAQWAELARDVQRNRPDSTLSLYRSALTERRAHALGTGELQWVDGYGDDVVAFRNGDITVIANVGATPVPLPTGATVVLTSASLEDGAIGSDTTVWLEGAR